MPVLFCTWSMASLWCFKRSLVWTIVVLDTSPCPLTLLKTKCQGSLCWNMLNALGKGASAWQTWKLLEFNSLIYTISNYMYTNQSIFQNGLPNDLHTSKICCVFLFCDNQGAALWLCAWIVCHSSCFKVLTSPGRGKVDFSLRKGTSWKLRIVVYCRFWPSTDWSTWRSKLTTWSLDNPHYITSYWFILFLKGHAFPNFFQLGNGGLEVRLQQGISVRFHRSDLVVDHLDFFLEKSRSQWGAHLKLNYDCGLNS